MKYILAVCLLLTGCAKDDTDPPKGTGWSGMDMYTDHGTGCQYLAKYQYGIMPRMGPNGKHMGCKDTN